MQDTQPKYFKVCVLLLDQLIAQTKDPYKKQFHFENNPEDHMKSYEEIKS